MPIDRNMIARKASRRRASPWTGGEDARPRARHGGDLGAGHSYTCRYRRTSRIDSALSASVIRNSAMPTTKIVSYLIEPVGMSPREVAAMNAAMDW